MKDENNAAITEFVGLRAKMYAVTRIKNRSESIRQQTIRHIAFDGNIGGIGGYLCNILGVGKS